MAITQQLARLTAERLSLCRSSTAAMDEICDQRVLADDEYLDLDWAPAALERAAEIAFGDGPTLQTLRRSTAGDAVVNAAYDGLFMSCVEPATALSPDAVQSVARTLHDIDHAMFDHLPADREAAIAMIGPQLVGGLAIHPSQYLDLQLRALSRFYDVAAARGLAMMMWWD